VIEKLTKSQEKKISFYRDRWLKIGLSTERIDRQDAIKRWHKFDKEILGNKNKVPVIFMDSPLIIWLATIYLYVLWYGDKKVTSQVDSQVDSQVTSQVRSQVLSQVTSQVRSQVLSQVWSQVDSQVRSQVLSQVTSQVRSQVLSQVWSQVASQVTSQVESQVRSQVGSQVDSQVASQVASQVESQVRSQVLSQVASQMESQVGSFVYPYLNLQFWAGYFGYYEFMNKELELKLDKQKEWDLLISLKDLSWVYPFKDFCVISEKPTEIYMKNGLLHNEKGMSVEYADGFGVYSLNGVRVSKELVMTSAEQLDPQLIVKETNAEIRREIVRKIGIERVCQKLNAKVLDKQDNYELLNLDLGNRIRPYLKMLNPSIGTYHIEGVHSDCKTVEQALNWRNQTEENPIVLT